MTVNKTLDIKDRGETFSWGLPGAPLLRLPHWPQAQALGCTDQPGAVGQDSWTVLGCFLSELFHFEALRGFFKGQNGLWSTGKGLGVV